MKEYKDFSTKVSEQKGNYLAIGVTSSDPEADLYINYEGGPRGETKLPKGGDNVVVRVTDTAKAFKIRAVKGGHETTISYSLKGLKLDPELRV